MAFNDIYITKLSNIAPANEVSPSLSLWHYKEAAAVGAIAAAGYFNAFRDQLQVDDLILVQGSDATYFLKVAAVPAAGNVTVSRVSGPAAGGMRVASGQATTVAASDTIVTGLATVTAVVATLNDDPVAGAQSVTASIGNQAGAPAAGSFLLKTWKATAAGDTSLIAATTFGRKVNWIAYGT
jgi:hypothetical protein